VASTEHGDMCPWGITGDEHSDAAKRASSAVNIHLAGAGFDAIRKWVAVRLADGGSDLVLYDTKRDAVRHQLHEQQCAYVSIPPGGMSPCEAESFIAMHRKMYDAGMRLTDPDHQNGGRDLIPALTAEDFRRQYAALKI